MTPFGSSSRQGQRANNDGSINIYCYICQEFIGRTFLKVNRALCEICRRVEAGESLTEEAIRAYKLSKADKVDVSMLVLNEPDLTAYGFKKFSLRAMAGDALSAVGRFLLNENAQTKEQTAALPSVKVARQKRRPRLFSNISLQEEQQNIGDMNSVDKGLKPK